MTTRAIDQETTPSGRRDDRRTPDSAVAAATTRPISSALTCRGVQATVLPLGVDDAFSAGDERWPDEDRSIAVHINAQQAVLGPFTGPDTVLPACATCFARRWQAVRPEPLRDALELGRATQWAADEPWFNPFAVDTLVAMLELAEGTAALEPGTSGSSHSTVFEVDLEQLTLRRERVVADPACPCCGQIVPDSAELATLDLVSAPKPDPSTFRRQDIDDYPIETAAFVNPLCGALGPTVVLDVTSTTTSATVGCFTLRSGDYLRETFWGGHEDTFDDSTRVGALEGLERAAGMQPRAKRTTVVAAFDDLDAPAVDPRECGLYAPDFYAENPEVRQFAPDRPITWVWGWSLRDDRAVLVPEVLTYYHISGLENRFVQESSNGCASGGGREEAVYFGLMEIIERDAFLLGWYGRAPLPEIDPLTSTRPRIRAMVHRLAMHGYRARFFDARVTFDIPVIAGVAERMDGGLGALCFGAGASLDPEAAMEAALREIATDSPNARQRTRGHEQRLRAMAADFDKVRRLHDHPLLYGIPEMRAYAGFLLDDRPEPVSLAERFEMARPAPPCSWDLRDDIDLCVQGVTAAGFDAVVVDQTMPEQRDLDLATCDVVVPGLLPIDFGWGRQRARTMSRLRTAPRAAGLRPDDVPFAQLNPAPHPFP